MTRFGVWETPTSGLNASHEKWPAQKLPRPHVPGKFGAEYAQATFHTRIHQAMFGLPESRWIGNGPPPIDLSGLDQLWDSSSNENDGSESENQPDGIQGWVQDQGNFAEVPVYHGGAFDSSYYSDEESE